MPNNGTWSPPKEDFVSTTNKWTPPVQDFQQENVPQAEQVPEFSMAKGENKPEPTTNFWKEVGNFIYPDKDPNVNPNPVQKFLHGITQSDFVKPIVNSKLAGELASPAFGIEGGLKEIADVMKNPGESTLNNTLKVATGTLGAAFNIMAPEFTVATDMIKKGNNEELKKVIDVPFTAVHLMAQKMGVNAEPGSTKDLLMGFGDILLPMLVGAGAKYSYSKIASFKELSDKTAKVADKTATPDEVKEVENTLKGMEQVTPADVVKVAMAKGTPEAMDIVRKIAKAQVDQPVKSNEFTAIPENVKNDMLFEMAKKEGIEPFKQGMQQLADAGDLSPQELADNTQRLNSYQKYWDQVKDEGFTDEKNKKIFDLTWKADNAEAVVSSIERKNADPNYSPNTIDKIKLDKAKFEHKSYVEQLKKVMKVEEKAEPIKKEDVGALTPEQTAFFVSELPKLREDMPDASFGEHLAESNRRLAESKTLPLQDISLQEADAKLPEVSAETTTEQIPAIIKKELPSTTDETTPTIKETVIEHDLKNGDKITATIGKEKVEGVVTGVGKHHGKMVIDFKDENGNERFIYGDQIDNIEKGLPTLPEPDNFTDEQRVQHNELLNKIVKGEDMSAKDMSDFKRLEDVKNNKSEPATKREYNGQKGLSPVASKAMRHEVTTAYDQVLQHFIGGGKIHESAMEKLYGGEGRPEGMVKEEAKQRTYLSKGEFKGNAIDDLAHKMWQEQKNKGQYDTSHFKDAIERVVNDYRNPTEMARELNDKMREVDLQDVEASVNRLLDEPTTPSEHIIESDIKPPVQGEDQFQKVTKVAEEIQNDIVKTKYELKAAKNAFESKAKELDKKIVSDQEDLFGERKSTDTNAMFEERVSMEARNKALEPFKVRIEKATEKLKDLNEKLKDEAGKEDLTLFSKSDEKGTETKVERKEKIDLLQKALPKIDVVEDKTIGEGIAGQLDADGKTVRLNPDYNQSDTAIHEFGHALIDILGGTKNSFIAKGIEQLRGTELWNKVEKAYPGLSPDMLAKEVLATAVGKEGSLLWVAKAGRSALRNWVDMFLNKVKRVLGIEKNVARNLATQLLGGKEIKGEIKATGEVQNKKIEVPNKFKPNSEEEYAAARKLANPNALTNVKDVAKKIKENLSYFAGYIFTPIETRLKNIHPELFKAIRKFQSDVFFNTEKDNKMLIPYFEKMQEIKKASKDDYNDLNKALQNADVEKMSAIYNKYDMRELAATKAKVLNEIYNRSKSVGIDLGFRENYHPNLVKDSHGLQEYIQKKLGSDYSHIEELIKAKEAYMEEAMSPDQKAQFVSDLMLGYVKGISIAKIGNMRERMIDHITPEMQKFYYDSNFSLIRYVQSANELIETRKWFGKGDNEKGYLSAKGTIGAKMMELIASKGISDAKAVETWNLLKSYFNKTSAYPAVTALKNMAFIDVMGHFTSAVRILNHIGYVGALEGNRNAIKAFGKAMVGKSEIGKYEAFNRDILNEFGHEQSTQSLLGKVFKFAGLNLMDKWSKEVIMNAHIEKMRDNAKDLDKLSPFKKKEFMLTLTNFFDKPQVDQIVRDLKNDKVTEDIIALARNRVIDLQPVAKSKMPKAYLDNPNGRIMYSLKMYTLNNFDVYRNEVIRLTSSKSGRERIEGYKKLVLMSASMAAVGATLDEIVEHMQGKKTTMSDRVVYGFLKIAGISPYIGAVAKKEGLGAVVKEELAPAGLVQPLQFLDDIRKGKLTKHIPFVGDVIYDQTHKKKH